MRLLSAINVPPNTVDRLMPPPPPSFTVASDALRARRYSVLASLAAQRVTATVVLQRSAPLLATGRESELVATVTFAPASRRFNAVTVQDGLVHELFSGPSLPLACSAANQALEDLAPLATAVRPPTAARYRRTRPAHEQDVHFADALGRLGELAGA
jgi:hypothetical protein